MENGCLPSRDLMLQAMLTSDRPYEGVFYTAVKTTGIFCRPSYSARKPHPENVDFYKTAEEALSAGFRPCLRCKPLDAAGAAPGWAAAVFEKIDRAPKRKWTDDDLVRLGADPLRLRRWCKEHFGTTFHAHIRARRLALALGALARGSCLDDAALDHGYSSLSGFREAVKKTFRSTPGRVRANPLLVYTRVLTPLGPMLAMAEARGLVLLEFVDRPALAAELEDLRARYGYAAAPGRNAHLDLLERELAAYFQGSGKAFSVPLLTPGSAFQERVWAELRRVPHGAVTTCGGIAQALGSPGASRAVGLANGANRISILIPCHRVVGADGALTGYGGGQPRKAFLLALERPAMHRDHACAAFQASLFEHGASPTPASETRCPA